MNANNPSAELKEMAQTQSKEVALIMDDKGNYVVISPETFNRGALTLALKRALSTLE